MPQLPESTFNLILSAIMGALGGLVTIPLSGLVSWLFKREEQLLQHKLDLIAKDRELFLAHKLEMEKLGKDNELASIREDVAKLQKDIVRLKKPSHNLSIEGQGE